MRKSVIIVALALVSLLALNGTAFMAFASEPSVVINPMQGLPGESYNFDIIATSWSTVSEIKVEDPEGNTWVLKGLTAYGWRTVEIWLQDAGDSIRLVWPEASFSVLNDPDHDIIIRSSWGSPITDLAWMNNEAILPHTQAKGTYSISFSGIGCKYFYVNSFFVVPEAMFGTLSILLTCIASLAICARVQSPRLKI